MPDTFQPLSALLAPAPRAHECDEPTPVSPEPFEEVVELEDGELLETARDVRLFHAHVREAIEFSVQRLLTDIAVEVLARELELGAADIAAVVARALERLQHEEPVRVRVHPDDLENARRGGLPAAADPELRRGDARFDVRNGSVDASLGVRLAAALERAR